MRRRKIFAKCASGHPQEPCAFYLSPHFLLTHVVDGGGGDDETVVADVGHLGDRQDLVLSRGRHDGQSRTTGHVTSERLNRLNRLGLSRQADLGPPRIELPSPSYLEKRVPSSFVR